MNDIKFSGLGLSEAIQRALAARGHTVPTPIQAKAIPALLKGRDMMGIAQTGTGKTGAFTLPILQRLAKDPTPARSRKPRALILAPTRELAIQIGDEIKEYGKHGHLRHAVIFGGVNQRPQVNALQRGVDILVATPGRLLDLKEQGHVRFSQVEVFVLDEADRMLDMGFIRDVRKIVQALPERRQSLAFSATMSRDVKKLAEDILDDPIEVAVTPQATPIERIEQRLYHVDQREKRGFLKRLVSDPAMERVLVFTRTKHRADRVTRDLNGAGIHADAIHGNKSQNARQNALKRFKSGETRILVATDIAARGIDVDGVTHVINFELPNEPESYVHRIGRTARAGNSGIAISFCDVAERDYLRDIERLTRVPLTVMGEQPASFEAPNDNQPSGEPRRGKSHRKKHVHPPKSEQTGQKKRSRRRRNRRRNAQKAAA